MKLLTASTLALIVATGGAMAETATTDMTDTSTDAAMTESNANLIRTRDITDGAVYTMNAADDEGWDAAGYHDGIGDTWNEIGEIEDLVLSRDGQLIGIVAEVGGFLDIADKHVMLEVQDVNLVAVDDETYAYVTRYSEEELEAMQGVDEGFWN